MKIQELQKEYGLKYDPEDNSFKDDFWQHQQSGQWILTHDAVEIIASKEGIKLVNIEVLNSEVDLVRFLITMSLPDGGQIQSIGEADRKNCHSQYLGCMAEKRGIDRCVLKLIKAYQYNISSEVEADDFKRPDYYQKREDHVAKFDELLKDEYFDGKRKDVKLKWKETNTLSQTDLFLKQMEQRIKDHNNNMQEA